MFNFFSFTNSTVKYMFILAFAFLGDRFIDMEILRKNIKTFYTVSFQFSVNFVVDI